MRAIKSWTNSLIGWLLLLLDALMHMLVPDLHEVHQKSGKYQQVSSIVIATAIIDLHVHGP